MRLWRISLLVCAASLFSAEAGAAGPVDELRLGVLAQGTGPFSGDKEDGAGINVEALFRPLSGLSAVGAPRPHLGGSVATDGDATSHIYGGLTWEQHFTPKLFLDLSGGVAVHNAETDFDPGDSNIDSTKYLGCRAAFRVSSDLGYRLTGRLSVSLHVDHISNAGLCDPNEGLDNAGVRLGLRF